MKRFAWLFFLHILAVFSFAQTFKGSVTDQTGRSIPYAALYLRESQTGFTTDEHGRFQTQLSKGSYTCEVSSLGFTSQTFSFQMPVRDYEKNFVLAERVYSLPEINVTKGGEDPAYAVMRKAIARAPYHRTQVKSFKAGTYLKGTGKGISIPALMKVSKQVREASKELLGKLFVLEEQQQVSFSVPNTWKSKVLAYKNSFPKELQVDMGMVIINFYSPELFGKISPLNPSAFSYYRFRLDGCFVEDGKMINKIRVIPKRENARLLGGDLLIVENLWCASAAEFKVWDKGVKANIKITCKEVEPSVFLPISTTMFTSISLMGFKAEASYLAAIHYTDVKTDIRQDASINEAAQVKTTVVIPAPRKERRFERPDRLVRQDKQIDSLASKRDSLYWTAVRSVPLRSEEMRSYLYNEKKVLQQDSLSTDKEHQETVVGQAFSSLVFGKTFHSSDKKAWLSLPNILGYVPEYNFVDGFWLGLSLKTGIKLSPSSTLSFNPSAHYATARKRWMGEAELALEYAPRRRGHFSISGGQASADYNAESRDSRQLNAFFSAFFAYNYIKFYERTHLTMTNLIEPFNGLLFTSSLSWQRRQMLDNHIHHSWFGATAQSNVPKTKAFRPMPDNEILKASFALEFTPAHYYHFSQGKKVYESSRYPTFGLQYDRAFPISGNQYLTSYHRMQFSAKQELEFGMLNHLHWSMLAGTFWGAKNLQFPDFKHFSSTSVLITDRSFDMGLGLLNSYALSTNSRWAQGEISWYTPYLLLKRLPFVSMKAFDEALHLRSIVIHGHRPYTELGYSVGLSDNVRAGVFVAFEGLKYHSVGVAASLPLSLLGLK